MNTLLLHHPACLSHDTGPRPESAVRLEVIMRSLQRQSLWSRCAHSEGRDAGLDELALVHAPQYIAEVRRLARSGGGFLDPDTIVGPRSYDAAVRAVGLALAGAEAILDGGAANALALVRPPGHHAFPDLASGFCIFNNVAVAARYLTRRRRLRRVLIVDWDSHHGNGTQDIFYRDGSVFYLSVHAWPAYPGTGMEFERGEGPGEGCTLNIPLLPGTGGGPLLRRLRAALEGPAARFRPEFVLVSAGFDGVVGDPVGALALEPEDFGALTRSVVEFAADCCAGRLLSVLEGGYNLSLLGGCVAAHLSALLAAEEAPHGGKEAPRRRGHAL